MARPPKTPASERLGDVAETREILPPREMTHSLHTGHFKEYIRETDGKTVEAGHRTYCMRCGATEGSARFEKGCRSVRLPNDSYEATRAATRIPRPRGNQPYSADLAEYFDLADWFGGLASTLGGVLDRQRDGGTVLPQHAAEPRLPAYMHDTQVNRRQRLTETWRALTMFPWDEQVALKDYYSGTGPEQSSATLRELHESFEQRLRLTRKPKRKKGAAIQADRTWTTTDLADRAGVSRQHMNQLLKDADLGTVPPQVGLGQPARVVRDSELAELANEFNVVGAA